MANLHSQFIAFDQAISITSSKKTKLIASRKALENKITVFFKAKPSLPVPRFFIQGSYKMGTMILGKDGTYDVDLGVYFLVKPTVTSNTLQTNVLQAVKDHTAGGVQHREKCIRVIYKGDFDIDLPVYYKTPIDLHPYLATKTGSWIQSDPKELCDWFEKKKDKNGQMVRVIKYIKAWANQRTLKMPSGIAITVWVANGCFKANSRDDIALLETIQAVRSGVFWGVSCTNPATPKDDLCAKLDSTQRQNFKDAMDTFIAEATKAINSTDSISATRIWQQMLGSKFGS